jgi:hypothetical protein
MLSEPGLITSQIVQHVIEDDLVIADLTGRNPNMFYEMALRHAVRKPIIQIIQTEETIPFDVAGMRIIQFDHTDLESVADCKTEIRKQIDAVERNPEQVSSPISFAVNLLSLRADENSTGVINNQVVSMLQGIQYSNDKLSLALDAMLKHMEAEFQLTVERGLKHLTDGKDEILAYNVSLRADIARLVQYTEDFISLLEFWDLDLEESNDLLRAISGVLLGIGENIGIPSRDLLKLREYFDRNNPLEDILTNTEQ